MIAKRKNVMDEFIGIVKLFAGNYAPDNWLFCHGQLLPVSQYQALFSILGNMYGGDGRTTFALPDLRGRVPVGSGPQPGASADHKVGEKWGNEMTLLSPANLPLKISGDATPVYPETGSTCCVSPQVPASFYTSPPSLGMHYIICCNGLYPPRS